MERLRFSRDLTERVAHLVRQHMFDYRPEWTDAAVRRFVRNVGVDAIADLFDLRIADNVGNGLKTGFPHYLEELRSRVERILEAEEALSVRDLQVDGSDVMRVLDLAPGPKVGEILNQLLEEVLEEPSLNRREALLTRLKTGFSVDTPGSGT
jgi:tRNA nucleotidyltransferase (CCA-adding enzyme)